jgi:hypothetical protein
MVCRWSTASEPWMARCRSSQLAWTPSRRTRTRCSCTPTSLHPCILIPASLHSHPCILIPGSLHSHPCILIPGSLHSHPCILIPGSLHSHPWIPAFSSLDPCILIPGSLHSAPQHFMEHIPLLAMFASAACSLCTVFCTQTPRNRYLGNVMACHTSLCSGMTNCACMCLRV